MLQRSWFMNFLHIEKSSLISGIVKKIIEESGNSIYHCADSISGLEIIRERKISFLIIGLDSENPEGELFLKKLHDSEFPTLPVLVLTENDSFVLNDQLFNYGVIDIINKKYISDDNFKRYFDIFLREDRLLRDLRNISVAVLDGNTQTLKCYKALFDFYGIKNTEYFSEPESLLSSSKCNDFYILDISMPRVSGEEVVKNIRERNRDSFVTAVITHENERVINDLVVAGADNFITKPFYANTFISRLKTDIRHYNKIKTLQKKP